MQESLHRSRRRESVRPSDAIPEVSSHCFFFCFTTLLLHSFTGAVIAVAPWRRSESRFCRRCEELPSAIQRTNGGYLHEPNQIRGCPVRSGGAEGRGRGAICLYASFLSSSTHLFKVQGRKRESSTASPSRSAMVGWRRQRRQSRRRSPLCRGCRMRRKKLDRP